MKPRLVYSELSGRVMVVTRYVQKDGYIVASEKYDVTEDFLALRKKRVRPVSP